VIRSVIVRVSSEDPHEFPCVLIGFGAIRCGVCAHQLLPDGVDVQLGMHCRICKAVVTKISRDGDPKYEGSLLP